MDNDIILDNKSWKRFFNEAKNWLRMCMRKTVSQNCGILSLILKEMLSI